MGLTKAEVTKILTMIATIYSRFEISELKVELWHDMLKDLPYELFQAAVKKVMLTSEFPPNIAQVRKAAVELTTSKENQLDAGKAWGEVQKAIGKYGWPEPEKAMESMSPMTRKAVEQLSWREICTAEETGVIRGQFMKMYNSLAEREKENNILPADFKRQIELSVKNLKMIGGS